MNDNTTTDDTRTTTHGAFDPNGWDTTSMSDEAVALMNRLATGTNTRSVTVYGPSEDHFGVYDKSARDFETIKFSLAAGSGFYPVHAGVRQFYGDNSDLLTVEFQPMHRRMTPHLTNVPALMDNLARVVEAVVSQHDDLPPLVVSNLSTAVSALDKAATAAADAENGTDE